MRDGTRLGLLALAVAALLGLLGDLLLRATPWGLNAPLWLLALVVGAGLLVWLARLPLLGEGRWLALVALAFAGGIALRASPSMVAVNVVAVLLTLGLAGHRAKCGWPRIGGLPQYVGALLSAGFHACGGVLVLAIYDVRWKEVPRTGWSVPVLGHAARPVDRDPPAARVRGAVHGCRRRLLRAGHQPAGDRRPRAVLPPLLDRRLGLADGRVPPPTALLHDRDRRPGRPSEGEAHTARPGGAPHPPAPSPCRGRGGADNLPAYSSPPPLDDDPILPLSAPERGSGG